MVPGRADRTWRRQRACGSFRVPVLLESFEAPVMLTDELPKVKKTGHLHCFGSRPCGTIRGQTRKLDGKAGTMARKRPANGSSSRLRVALAQVEPVLGDLAANIPMHMSWARRAIARGADLVIFPELILAQDGADYLLVLSAGPTEGIDRRRGIMGHTTWKDVVKVTAQMQTIYVAYANRVGFEDGINFGGRSCVFDPFGEALAEAVPLDEGLLVCDLGRSTLRRARTMYPLLRDERLAVLAREVQRLLAVPGAGKARRSA